MNKCTCGEVSYQENFEGSYLKDAIVHTNTSPCFLVETPNISVEYSLGHSQNMDSVLKLHQKSIVGDIVTREPDKLNKASKNDKEKIDISLIPYVALQTEAKAFMVGAVKYGRYNYCKGHEASQLVAAAQRHLLAWFQGEELDPQDGQPHLGSVRACVAMILRQQELGTLIDNRYKKDEK